MTTQLQKRRGTTAEHSTFTGAEGEVTVDTTKDTAVVHDGVTAGGRPLAREDLNNVSTATVAAKLSGGTLTGNLTFGDNDKAIFGAGSDLQIYHDGSNSFIRDAGTGNLVIRGTNLNLQKDGGEAYVSCVADGAVTLHYDNAPKLATTFTGIDVTGTATMDGLTVETAAGGIATAATFAATATNSNPSIVFNSDLSGTQHDVGRIRGQQDDTSNGGLVLGTVRSGVMTDSLRAHANGDISFYEDTGTTAKFFWDASAESLGIGTTSPSAPLTVQGGTGTSATIQLNGGSAGNDNASIHSLYNLNFKADSSESIAGRTINFAIGTTTGMTINSSGNVGIGTTTPNQKLHINGGAADTAFQITNSASGSAATDGFSITVENPTPDVAIRNRESSNMKFFTANTERMRIDSSGNLLVGKTSDASAVTTDGINLRPAGYSTFTATSKEALQLARQGTDGDILDFYKDGTTVGSIGTNEGRVNLTDDTFGGISPNSISNALLPVNNAGNATNNLMDLGTNSYNFKDLHLSGGVVFGATGGAVTSKTLDDYETGDQDSTTVTPQTSGTISLSTTGNNLGYEKVGDMVHVHGTLDVISVSSPVGNWVTIPIPFAVANTGDFSGQSTATVVHDNGTVKTVVPSQLQEATSVIYVYLDASTVLSSSFFFISVTYRAA